MRMVFGVLGLLLVVAIIGILAKKQLASVAAPHGVPTVPGAESAVAAPGASPKQQVQQFQQAVQGHLQQAMPMPDEKYESGSCQWARKRTLQTPHSCAWLSPRPGLRKRPVKFQSAPSS